ncbi:MAG: metallophosphoesterase [Verrucomicrobia bacterium]|nr:metallophosphoesterase [Verrucomicrobiota bacterium]MBV8483955.1 metallophosphoesterase [Verrucomicrobiota bacterium]
MSDHIHENLNDDGVDRRGFLKCMAWAGTGLVFTMSAGIARSRILLAPASDQGAGAGTDFTFVQISDSHIGFNKDANNNVIGTLQEAINRIKALPTKPDLIIHTGDLTHLAEADEFDTVDQALKGTGVSDIFYVPGEHDVLSDNGEQYRNRFAKGTNGDGWYSFTHRGVHFVGLVNVMGKAEAGLGSLGQDQLTWLDKDLSSLSTSTPIIVFAHVPLWEVYPQWGWGTQDGAQALALLKRFGSVSVLNGHIHQIVQKVEGNITFHTAMSTAFPQPAPGTAPKAGPMKVPADQLKKVLGITTVNYLETPHSLAVIDKPLIG